MTKSRVVMAMLFAVLSIEEADADIASDLELAHNFSPILILSEDTGNKWGDIRVIKPEPVKIVGADTSSSLWFNAYTLDNSTFVEASAPLDSSIWSPRMYENESRWYPNGKVRFHKNKFAFFDYSLRYHNQDGKGGLPAGQYNIRGGYFNYPG